MPKGSPELTKSRRDEIIEASIRLYDERIFKDITIKDIAERITFARSNIYNYFQTKEEIFLAIFEEEYKKWNCDLKQIVNENITDKETLSVSMAKSLEKRKLMLKLLAVNLYDLEENCRMECLVSFKKEYAASRELIAKILKNYVPDCAPNEIEELMLTLLQFFHGVYPYSFATEKQNEAMDKAGIRRRKMTIYDLSYAGIKRIL